MNKATILGAAVFAAIVYWLACLNWQSEADCRAHGGRWTEIEQPGWRGQTTGECR